MESALLNLVGVALAHLAMVTHGRRAVALPVEGRDVISHCLAQGRNEINTVVAKTLGSFWPELVSGRVPRDLLTRHVGEVATLIKSTSTAGCCAKNEPNGQLLGKPDVAKRVAQDICGRNSTIAPSITERQCNEQNQHTLSMLFKALIGSRPQLDACLESIADFVSVQLTTMQPRSTEAAALALARVRQDLLQDTGISPRLLDAIIASSLRLGLSIERIEVMLIDKAVVALELLGEIHHLADRAGVDDQLEVELERVAGLLREGKLAQAGCDLAIVSRNIESGTDFSARLMPDLRGTAFFPRLLAARAGIASLDGEPREASRLYERAVLYWPREDRIQRWTHKLLQARELVVLGRLPSARTTVLCEAAQIYAAAGGLICESDCPRPWAEANIELGNLLLELGDRESRPERYLAAALHFKPALEVFTRERDMDGWAQAQVGLAHALRGQASFQGDVVTLREAAFAYRAAMGILTEDGTPEEWYTVRSCLGDALVRIAEESGDVEALQQATELLMTLADGKSEHFSAHARAVGEIALGRTMLFLVETDAEPVDADANTAAEVRVLNDAIGLIDTALRRPGNNLTALEQARAESSLGSAYWQDFSRTGSSKTLELAIAAKQRARAVHEELDNPIETDFLDESIARMRASQRQAKDANGKAPAAGNTAQQTAAADVRTGPPPLPRSATG